MKIKSGKEKHLSEEERNKRKGSGNNMYGKVFISNGKINKSIKKEELDDFLKNNPEWKRGRVFEYTITKNKKFPTVIYNFPSIKEFNELAQNLPNTKIFNYTNGKKNIKIPENLINKYESLGYYRGITQLN